MAAFFTFRSMQRGQSTCYRSKTCPEVRLFLVYKYRREIYKSMSNLISHSLGGKNSLLTGSIGLVILLMIVGGCTGKNDSRSNANNGPATESKASDMPDDAVLKANVKLTTAQFANAISTEDFTTLRDNASDEFKEKYTAEQAKEVFA